MRGITYTLARSVAIVVVLAFCASCSKEPETESVPERLPPAKSIHFQFAVYYLPLPSSDQSAALVQLLSKEEYSRLRLVEKMPEAPSERLVSAYVEDEPQKEYAPPDMDALRYCGRGVTREQGKELQNCEKVLILNFGHPRQDAGDGLRTAYKIAEALARETGGFLWDEETREVWSPDEWHRERIASWTEETPDVSDHITIHAYKADEYVRAITLGMAKLGLPDVVVEDSSWSMNRSVGHLINLFCQAMAEGASVEALGDFDLDIRAIRNPKVRDPQLNSLKPNATGVALLSLRKGQWEDGDPDNRLIEIFFDRYPGPDDHAKRERMLTSLFGWEDSIVPATHNDEILAASKRAKAQLPALRKAFGAGLHPGEFIQVKAPFPTPDGGREYMWVEITAWRGKRITGLLKNEPFNIPSLHGGQIVEVKQEDVFDYIRRYPDGTEEGNATGAILEKMQQELDK